MTDTLTRDAYGTLIEPTTLRMHRLLPGPIERIWAYLTESELRRQWLAAGTMDLTGGAPFEMVWRNDELSDPPSKRPDGFGAEHRMECRILAAEPPHRLMFAFGPHGEVEFTLAPQGAEVLLTMTHRRVPNRSTLLSVSAGWHRHLDVLVARANGRASGSFWDAWAGLKAEYEGRFAE